MKWKRRRTHGGLCDTKEEKGSVPCALSLVARAVRGKAGVSTDWRAARARSRRRQNYGRLLDRGQAYQQVAIGQLEGGGSTMEAHGMLSSLVVRRGKRTRALVGGEQAANERAERLKATWEAQRGPERGSQVPCHASSTLHGSSASANTTTA
ncbi:hypothetical protein LI328DRAFT_159675 [Trichoderma asperelloides]|nr:hypothetical protein LI328DRAFT_159675 [Trichoderma asperelloides]